jgi:hypothetical protein
MKKALIIAIILLFAGVAGAGDKPQFKKIWTYENSGVTPCGRPPMQADDEYYVANDAWKFYSWVKNHPDWRRTADGNEKDQYGGLWFYIEVCKGCPLPYTGGMKSLFPYDIPLDENCPNRVEREDKYGKALLANTTRNAN